MHAKRLEAETLGWKATSLACFFALLLRTSIWNLRDESGCKRQCRGNSSSISGGQRLLSQLHLPNLSLELRSTFAIAPRRALIY